MKYLFSLLRLFQLVSCSIIKPYDNCSELIECQNKLEYNDLDK